jgi:hypothetical protein
VKVRAPEETSVGHIRERRRRAHIIGQGRRRLITGVAMTLLVDRAGASREIRGPGRWVARPAT